MLNGILIRNKREVYPKNEFFLSKKIDMTVRALQWPTFFERLAFSTPDIVFIDVDEKDNNEQIKCLDILKSHGIKCVVLASSQTHAYTALKHSAFDYILKPLQDADLICCINRAEIEMSKAEVPKPNKRFSINCTEGSYFFDFKEIVRCQAESNYTKIYCLNSTITVSKTLKTISSKLPENLFLRTHKSHLVNSMHIKSIKHGKSSLVITSDGCEIPISRNKKSYINEALNAS